MCLASNIAVVNNRQPVCLASAWRMLWYNIHLACTAVLLTVSASAVNMEFAEFLLCSLRSHRCQLLVALVAVVYIQ